ncbi:hypothetical protein WJX77_012674 [Trebouxia sp. C0004]
MPLNPFAREYVPGVGRQISLLNVSSPASSVNNVQLPASPEPAQAKDGTQPVGSDRCPTPAAEALEVEELQFEDVFEAEAGPPSPRSHLSPVSPGGLSMVSASSSPGSTPESPVHSALPPSDMPPNQSGEIAGQPSNLANAKVGPADFLLLRVVGQGAFGKVFQVQKKDTGQVYAMKVMRKERIIAKDHGEYVRAERNVLTAVFHPYIVTLRCSFQTSSKLYLVLDFINGGHLFFQLYRQGIFGEQLARLYTAEIVLAIAHLHSLGFVHRDLKPENVLLDSEGHIKVTDFGLAKGNMADGERTNSFIGTMEYMAPEIIQGKGHGKDVDWWSVGILLFEMMTGMPPFNAKSRNQLQKQITGGKLKYPSFLSRNAQTLLKGLLVRDVEKRLGHGPEGSKAVMDHPFFSCINWDKLQRREIPSPFKPSTQGLNSVENFDKMWTEQSPTDSPAGTPTNLESMFHGYSYCTPHMLANYKQRSPSQ